MPAMTTPAPNTTQTATAKALAAFAKPIQIFRAGTRMADDGEVYTITTADLKAAAAAYDPAVHEAPLVLGHPDDDAPAWGGVAGLQVSDDGVLSMLSQQVAPAFAEGVQAGRYKKRSAAFYHPQDPNNPKPGVWYLRHVGFLGAKPPAVKGLRDIKFATGSKGICFSESDGTVARMWRQMRDFFIAQFGTETADRVLPDWQVAGLETAAVIDQVTDDNTDTPLPGPAFSEPSAPTKAQESDPMDKELQAKLDAEATARKAAEERAAALEQQLAGLAAAQAAQRHTANVAFAEAAVSTGKWLPKDKDELVAALDAAGESNVSRPVQFGEGDAKKALDLVGLIQRLVNGQSTKVQFGEFADGRRQVVEPGSAAGRSDAEIHEAAQAYANQHKVSYSEALTAVTKPVTFGA